MKNIQTVLNAILSKNVFEYLLIDQDFRTSYSSSGISEIFKEDNLEGEDVRDILPELVGLEEDIEEVFKNPEHSVRIHIVEKYGLYFNIFIDHYSATKALVLLQNITEITKAQQEAQQHSNQTLLLYDTLQKVIDEQNTLIFMTDHKDQIAFTNKKFLRYFQLEGGEDQQITDLKVYQIVSEDLKSYSEMHHYIESHNKQVAIGSDVFIVEVTQVDTVHTLFTLSKVTDIYEEKKNLEAEVEIDTLTRVIRKKYFDQRIQQLLNRKVPFALCVVDIDDFKAINDTYGHPVGDKVLQQFATLLKKSIRSEDLIARWGGEEFLIAVQIDNLECALDRIEAIRESVDHYPFEEIGHLTASFGLAWREHGDDLESLLQRADEALYRAKKGGKNRVEYKKRGKSKK